MRNRSGWKRRGLLALCAGVCLLACSKFEDKQGNQASGAGGTAGTTGSGGSGGAIGPTVIPIPPADWNPDTQKKPKYIHLTWQNDPASTITAQWRTEQSSLEGYSPKIWVAPASLCKIEGSNVQLAYADGLWAAGEGATVGSTAQWTAEIKGLQPATQYYYRVGTWDGFDTKGATFQNANLSPVASFRTAPAKGAASKIRFVVAGDSRDGNAAIQANIGRLKGLDVDFWLFSGDMTALGSAPEWDAWFGAMSPLMTNMPFMPVQGNHEVFADLYYGQFALPRMAGLDESYVEHNWSINYGNIHIIGLDSNTDATVKGAATWLDQDLAASEADPSQVWKIALFHHPAYSACQTHGSTTRVQQSWVPLFEKHGLDMTLSGHDHDYERSFPVRGSQKVSPGQGVVHVVAGGFYAPGYSAGTDWWTQKSVSGNVSNYLVIEVQDRALHAVAYSGDGNQVLDDFSLTK
jgi:hypothetical protein